EVPKDQYKQAKDEMAIKLGVLQRRAKELGIPVAIVFEGLSAAGKGTLINELILPLDPRGFTVHSALPPNEEEALRPFLWRFWTRTPARGRLAVFDRSWYRRVLVDRVCGEVKGKALQQAYEDIRSFERQLAEDGCVILKFWLHISKKEQKRRFDKLRNNAATAWRVTRDDLKAHRQYDEYIAAADDTLAETDTDAAPWTVVESTDRRFAALKIFNALAGALEKRIAQAENVPKAPAKSRKAVAALPPELRSSILDQADLSLSLERDDYRKRLKAGQERLRELEHEIYVGRVPVAILYQGWDAAGKGGNIRRLTQDLDPRGYNVVPIGVPNDVELAHHYLWRFWTEFPKAGHIAIFDRSWYGRVLVERVEGLCTEAEWRRAYREINEMEQHMTNFGTVLLKFWLHIDKDEQLQRFEARQQTPYKQWKITDEDWRNREKWDAYKAAVEEMLFRTSTPYAPWTVVESNCKWYARVKALDTVREAIEKALKR
ncbi:MAG TPA: polyphosphate:AMP phosphotransferase, partial [Phycisphaerae bacterium]|nr:polyphosphate:AMP phosphotransferase [Phycisphaerae bacterium]